MVQDEFEMENQGYEEEPSTRPTQRVVKRTYFVEPSSIESSRLPIGQENIRPIILNGSRIDPEAHVYEDIVVSDLDDSITGNNTSFRLPAKSSNNNNHNCNEFETTKWPKNFQIDNKNARNLTKTNNIGALSCHDGEHNSSNFHRNLTLPLRTGSGGYDNADNTSRFSVRVTNRERTRCSTSENDSFYESSIESTRIDDERGDDDEDGTIRVTNNVVDKPGRRRRKKDCKHCKSKANGTIGILENNSARTENSTRQTRDSSFTVNSNTGRVRPIVNNEIDVRDEKTRIGIEPIFSLPDGKLPIFNAQCHNNRSQVSTINDEQCKNTIFSISNNVNSTRGSAVTKSLNYDKNDTDVRLVSVELNDDRALITPQKNRTGMKVNSIYSQENWRNKDVPIFVTDSKEQTFQRAYSLPTRTQTPSSQNRVNLRRSVRGEPPPHPARLRKNRRGWTLHFARPLDGTGCTRSIVLLLIAVFALLGIGGIALYIVFEPEKLQIIQQYLRSSTSNATRESNSTLDMGSLGLEANIEITTLPIASVTFNESPAGFPRETTFSQETETELVPTTTTEITLDRNVTRHCDDCYEAEVCVALVDEEVPICRIGPDSLDPTGCNGLCLINKQKCHRLDFDAFRCVEVEHYCLDDEWTCSNTLCIPLVKHCDGHMNCYDHSDEYDCVCDLQTHFQCGNETSCLPLERRCDGKIDCWDATDEINCTLACPSSSEFTCSNGECILKARFCDGLRDCTDGSDEPHGCQGRCNKHEFSCLNGRCITKGMKCNGIDDCGDGSDEQHCRDRIFKKPIT